MGHRSNHGTGLKRNVLLTIWTQWSYETTVLNDRLGLSLKRQMVTPVACLMCGRKNHYSKRSVAHKGPALKTVPKVFNLLL